MSNPISAILDLISKESISFIDLRFTDTRGKEQHVTVPARSADEDFFRDGKMFDGSSIAGWKNISASDMILMPDLNHYFIDPFFEEPTLVLRCDIVEPATMMAYERDPRAVAKRAEAYLRASGIADACYFGPEPEFFIFDNVRWDVGMRSNFYEIDSEEAAWNSGAEYDHGNHGYRPRVKGGYFPVPPVDSSQDIRSAICLILEELGMDVETHHHEVATANQCEINTKFRGLLEKADEMQVFKYVVTNTAHIHGKTVTFMPKPLVGDNGSGMHVHQSLAKAGKNLFSGDKYAGLSDTALYYIGGIIKHGPALNAFTNGTTNSYKRLVPGYEAPVILAYSSRNRSASIRVPYVTNPKGRRIEVRFPDALCNPYLAFSAMMMAGLDGIRNKIHPGEAMDKDLYDLPPEELRGLPTVAGSLSEALDALDKDRGFLLEGEVFTNDLIDAYIKLKREEDDRVRTTTHPVEFDLYYSA